MSNHRFASGQATTITTTNQSVGRRITQPYDQTLRFNRIIDQKPNDPSSIIYSIDPSAFLKMLEIDQLEDLHKITLACRPTREGVGMWDTLFNTANRQSLTACILLAQNDFTPIPQSRVVVGSQFLNFSMAVSRVHLNQVIEGDRITVGIHDMTKKKTYVLLYTIEDRVFVPSPDVAVDGRPSQIPAVNIKLGHALCIEYDGEAALVNMDDEDPYDPDKAIPLIRWVADAVYDITESYPWKPHFLPFVPQGYDRNLLETRIAEEKDTAVEISYEDFQKECRRFYKQAKDNRDTTPIVKPVEDPEGSVGKRHRKRPNARVQPKVQRPPIRLPLVEILTLGDRYVAKFDDNEGSLFTFGKNDLDNHEITETYLTNRDLDNINVDESSKVLVLSPGTFGDNAFLRYFTLNF